MPYPDKSLPGNTEAERMILGVALLDNSVFDSVIHQLTPGDFILNSHGDIFRAMVGLREVGVDINPVTLQEELLRNGSLERVGGPAYVAGLFDGCPRFSSVRSYVDIVKTKSRQRQLIRLGQKIVSTGFDDEAPLNEQLVEAERGLLDISKERGGSSWLALPRVASDYIQKVRARGAAGRPVIDYSSGFSDLDYFTLGFERRTMVVLASRPGMGKTALGLAMSKNMSESRWNIVDGLPPVIAWFSMEMPAEQLSHRWLASVAGVDARRLQLGQLKPEEWLKIERARDQIAQWRVVIDDRVGLTPRVMRDAVRSLKQEHGKVDIVFVDYLQLGDGERQRGDSREVEVGRISRGLVSLAKDLDVCVVAIAQLNRAADTKADKRPSLNDLRESGQIEQDAYIVMGLYRDEYYNPHTDEPGVAELIILKQRNGPLATVKLMFDGSRMMFGGLAREGRA